MFCFQFRAAMLVRSLPVKSRKSLAHAVGLFYTFAATPAGLVHDVTDTECWAQMVALTVVFP